MEKVVVKPLGQVLERAGLISEVQLRTALELQSQGYGVKLGKILVSQGILTPKTVDFFAEQWPQLCQQPRTKILGYYLQAAALLDSQQIEALLEEQKHSKRRLGELAVEKGWLREKTLHFFLQHLGTTAKKRQLSCPDQVEIIQSLHLETKSAAPYSLLKEVFEWTGGHPVLTRQLCQVIAEAKDFITLGREAVVVDKLVQEQVIQDWERQVMGKYLKTIQEQLLHNTVCLPQMLLQLYLQILQQGEISTNSSREQEELRKLGLVIGQENQLKVANRLYQSIFNPDWVKKQLLTLEKKSPTRSNQGRKIPPANQPIAPVTPLKNEPLTYLAATVSVLGLLILFPLVMVFNNSSPQRAPENSSLDSGALSRSTWCVESMPGEEAIQEDWRLHLEQEQQKSLEEFPANCQRNLDQLRMMKAIQLGRNNRVLEGIEYLCQISPNSASFNQAQLWLSRWYTNAHWGEPTQSYLPSMSDCPVAQWKLNNYEWATHYQQARDYLEQSEYPLAWESLYLASEQAMMEGQPTLLLAKILKQEQGIWQSVAQQFPQQWQLLKELLLKAEADDYQITYQRAKLQLDGDQNHHHSREFELLFAAARIAIEHQQSESMLSQLQQDRQDRFKNLARGHSEWLNLIKALEQNNPKFLAQIPCTRSKLACSRGLAAGERAEVNQNRNNAPVGLVGVEKAYFHFVDAQ